MNKVRLIKEESYFSNGQLSFRYWKKQIPEIIKPVDTYGYFYWFFFSHRWELNFTTKLKDHFKRQKKFLSKLGFQELANEDKILFDKSRKYDRTNRNCESYFDNGRLKFKYTLKDHKDPLLDNGTQTFELFYKNGRPKFKFSYKVNEINGTTGNYQMYYGNGQLKEKGSLTFSDGPFERFSRNGQLTEKYNNETFEKYHENEKLHYRITIEGGKKQGPFELYNQAGNLIEKGMYSEDEMYDGPSEWYYEDGKIYEKCYYKNGVLDGPYYEENPYGGARINGFYIDGKRMDREQKTQFNGFNLSQKPILPDY